MIYNISPEKVTTIVSNVLRGFNTIPRESKETRTNSRWKGMSTVENIPDGESTLSRIFDNKVLKHWTAFLKDIFDDIQKDTLYNTAFGQEYIDTARLNDLYSFINTLPDKVYKSSFTVPEKFASNLSSFVKNVFMKFPDFLDSTAPGKE